MCRSPCPPELSRKELGVKSCSEEIQQGWWEVCISEPKMQVQWERGRERRSGGSPAAVPLGSPPPRQCADDGTTGPWKKNQIRKPCYYIWRVRMTSWRKDTSITVARDILLQEHSCPAQTVAPRPGGSPSWAASRGCGALAAGGGGGCRPSCPRLLRPPRWLQPRALWDSSRALPPASCVQRFGLFIATL